MARAARSVADRWEVSLGEFKEQILQRTIFQALAEAQEPQITKIGDDRAERPGIGAAPLFPSPGDPTKPMTRHLADKWLRKAEKSAGVEPQKGLTLARIPSKVGHRKETPI